MRVFIIFLLLTLTSCEKINIFSKDLLEVCADQSYKKHKSIRFGFFTEDKDKVETNKFNWRKHCLLEREGSMEFNIDRLYNYCTDLYIDCDENYDLGLYVGCRATVDLDEAWISASSSYLRKIEWLNNDTSVKLNDYLYEDLYKACENENIKYPETFKAKYN